MVADMIEIDTSDNLFWTTSFKNGFQDAKLWKKRHEKGALLQKSTIALDSIRNAPYCYCYLEWCRETVRILGHCVDPTTRNIAERETKHRVLIHIIDVLYVIRTDIPCFTIWMSCQKSGNLDMTNVLVCSRAHDSDDRFYIALISMILQLLAFLVFLTPSSTLHFG